MHTQVQREPRWLQMLRAEVSRTSARRTARKLDYSDRTIRLVLQGKYRSNTQGIARNVLDKLSAPRKPRAVRPEQLRHIDVVMYRTIKPYVLRWGYEIVARWYGLTGDELSVVMRGLCMTPETIQKLIANVQQRGYPTPPACKHCGGAL